MADDIAISLTNISKVFKRYHRPSDRLKELLLPGKPRSEEFWALQDINLEINKGDTVGIIGRNGSGKSTLLQIIAGTLKPTIGSIAVRGRVSALLELGSGFNPEFTGTQNIFFNGRILGLTQAEIESKFDQIAAFADIGTFINQPVKTYSSGMFVRLGFAVAVHVDPEVFIIDEALAVGDMFFQHRCMRKIQQLMDTGVTTLFVSHDGGAVKSLCNWAALLHDGKIQSLDTPSLILSKYARMLTELELAEKSPQESSLDLPVEIVTNKENYHFNENESSSMTRRGDRRIEIEKVKLFNSSTNFDGEIVIPFDQEVKLRIYIASYTRLHNCIVGYFICDKNGNEVIGTNTEEEGLSIKNIAQDSRFHVDFLFRLPLRSGTYSVTIAVTEDQTSVMSDWIDNALVFRLQPPEDNRKICGMVSIPIDVNVSRQA